MKMIDLTPTHSAQFSIKMKGTFKTDIQNFVDLLNEGHKC